MSPKNSRNPTIDLLKWILLGLMIYDHALLVFWPEYLGTLWRTPALLVYPGFGYLWSYTYREDLDRVQLMGWAMLAQIPYSLIFGLQANILWGFLIASLPLPLVLLFGLLFDPWLSGGFLGVAMLFFARSAALPALPQVNYPVYPAKHFLGLYGGHLAVICWAFILFPN